ncbi:LamG-like jellyroll fold domain-containing protein [Pseudazoarcus pumilus]|uniref:LamG-like jellyroll fold domain-containing protein n=1 Tax=Pseudazoarcus pumilus TaxID=2067960 RepID=UPI000F4E1F83|nr:LamG-like jellyroll fold domain-containing protein [Pseudazoarcus pumilus]
MSIPHYDKVALLLPMFGDNNGVDFRDYGPQSRSATAIGDAKTVTSQGEHYGSCAYFDGAGDAILEGAVNADWTFLHSGAEPWTLAVRVRPAGSADYRTIVDTGGGATANRGIYLGVRNTGALRLLIARGTGGTYEVDINTSAGVVPSDAWNQVVLDFDGTTIRLCVGDAVVGSSARSSPSSAAPSSPLRLFATSPSSASPYAGYAEDFVIWRGASIFGDTPYELSRLVGEISGNVTDATGDPAERRIFAVPRAAPVRGFETVSDAAGDYSLMVPATECSRIVLADDDGDQSTPVRPDRIRRIIPQ